MVLRQGAIAAAPACARATAALVRRRRAPPRRDRLDVPRRRHVQGLEHRARARPVRSHHAARRAAVRLRSARRQAAAALPFPAERHHPRHDGDQRVRLARRTVKLRAQPAHDPHRVRRRLDGGEQPSHAALLSRIRRAFARAMGQGARARCALRGPERSAREHQLDRHRRRRSTGSGAPQAGPRGLLRRRQPNSTRSRATRRGGRPLQGAHRRGRSRDSCRSCR